MAPLLQPSECSILFVDPRARHIEGFDWERRDSLHRRFKRVQKAASAAAVPCHFVVEEEISNSQTWLAIPNETSKPHVHAFSTTGQSWTSSGIATALATEDRACILLCGFWLETTVTFMALSALSSGLDVFVSMDVTPSRTEEVREPAYDRLLQAGAVPTTTHQFVSEWIDQSADSRLRADLFKLIQST